MDNFRIFMEGRTYFYHVCFTAVGVCNILSGLTNNWKTFLVTRVFAGFFVGGCAIAFTLARELIGAKVWNWAGMLYHISFSLGMGVLAALSLWLQDWRLICYVTGGLTCLLSFSFYPVMIESPRWLHSVGKSEKASQLLESMAKKNGRNPEGIDWTLSQLEEMKSSTLVDLFRHKTLVFWLIMGAFIWSTAALIYYGLTLSVSDLTPNLFLGTALSGLVEVPGSLLSVFLLNSPKFGKKRTTMFTFTVCLIGLIGMAARPDGPEWWRLTFGLTAKLAIAANFNVLFLYCIEIFPTTMRTASLGFSSTMGRIGAIIAPFINLTDTNEPRLPYIIYSITCALSIIATIFLPSTESCPLPQNVEEALSRKSQNNKDDETGLINSEFES